MTRTGIASSPRAPHLVAAAALAAVPDAAVAQEVPLWFAAGLFSPLVMLILAAILGWLRHSVMTALGHGALIVVWVGAFIAASQRTDSDLLVWAPVLAYGLHGLVLLVLVVVSAVRRRAAASFGE